jgi:phosphonate transport system substrate-binding protein
MRMLPQQNNECAMETGTSIHRCLAICASLVCAVVLGTTAGCDAGEVAAERPAYVRSDVLMRRPVLTLGVHPMHNPARLMTMYGPIVEALNVALPDVDIRLEASRDYSDYERKLRAGTLALALPNPYQTAVVAKDGYRVFGKVMRDDDFYGVILKRRDGPPMNSPADLRGKTFSCPARTALAACMMPLMYLRQGGLDVAADLRVTEVGSQESSILNIVRGLVDAGATWPPAWRAFGKTHPDLAGQVEVVWRTDTLPNNGLMARNDIDAALVRRIAGVLFALSDSEDGRRRLAGAELAGFEPADEGRYAPVLAFMDRYTAQIGPLAP